MTDKWLTPGDDPQPYWWGMPSFENGDARPAKRLSVNFQTWDDYLEFCNALGLRLTEKTKATWYPPVAKSTGVVYDGPKVSPRYPVCIPSKGRWFCQKTGNALDRMGVDYLFFVEETEADLYRQHVGEHRVVSMPFHDLGQGSIPARNFIWDWAKEREHARHWVVDDNIRAFARCDANRRKVCLSGGLFRAMEDFVDRYENVAIAGPHDKGFVNSAEPNISPVCWNSRVYSCILIDTNLPHRWRGRYNEDTDLSLRLLKDGYCTALFRALLMDKCDTGANPKAKPLPGGNTDNVYNTGDHRRAFAESLQQQHPDVVKVVWKFNRWHHQVDYRPFKNNKPILRPGVVPTGTHDDYGMVLRRRDDAPEAET